MGVVDGNFPVHRQNDKISSEVANGGEPPYDGDMENRVKALEEFVGEARNELRTIDVRLGKIEATLPSLATKADLHEAIASMIKWVVGTAIVLGASAVTIITFVLNNATPRAPTSSVAPIIIQIPSQPTAIPQPKQP